MVLNSLSIIAGCVIVGTVILVALAGWGGQVSRTQKISLCGMAAGLLWAAPGRFLGLTPDIGDAMFLIGLAVYVVATYGRSIGRRADTELDEAFDELSAARRRRVQ